MSKGSWVVPVGASNVIARVVLNLLAPKLDIVVSCADI